MKKKYNIKKIHNQLIMKKKTFNIKIISTHINLVKIQNNQNNHQKVDFWNRISQKYLINKESQNT